jgi:hypothetical protein
MEVNRKSLLIAPKDLVHAVPNPFLIFHIIHPIHVDILNRGECVVVALLANTSNYSGLHYSAQSQGRATRYLDRIDGRASIAPQCLYREVEVVWVDLEGVALVEGREGF